MIPEGESLVWEMAVGEWEMELELLQVSSAFGGIGVPAGHQDLHDSSGMRDMGRPGCE